MSASTSPSQAQETVRNVSAAAAAPSDRDGKKLHRAKRIHRSEGRNTNQVHHGDVDSFSC